MLKLFEYVLAHSIFRIFEKQDERSRKEHEKWEIESVRMFEEKNDKGSWVYDEQIGNLDFKKPKKNKCFVTIEENEGNVTIILSKKPYSINSKLFDYIWDAEEYCSIYASVYRDERKNVKLKREISVFIADDDIACPYCRNSSPKCIWISNTVEQEMMNIQQKYSTAEIDCVKTNFLWCPVCNCKVDKKYLLVKGDEWKEKFLNELPPSSSNTTPLQIKQQEEDRIRLQYEKEKRVYKIIEMKFKGNREVITNPLNIVKQGQHKGLVVKVIVKVITKDKEIYKEQWIKAINVLPNNAKISDPLETSYIHSDDFIRKMPKRNKNFYPTRYCNIEKLITEVFKPFDFYEDLTEEYLEKYNTGLKLPTIKIYKGYGVISNSYLIKFAWDIGLTHVPVIVFGEPESKIQIEKELKNKVEFVKV